MVSAPEHGSGGGLAEGAIDLRLAEAYEDLPPDVDDRDAPRAPAGLLQLLGHLPLRLLALLHVLHDVGDAQRLQVVGRLVARLAPRGAVDDHRDPADRGRNLAAVGRRSTAGPGRNGEPGRRVLGEVLAATLVDQPLPLGPAHRASRVRAVPELDREID